MQSKGCSALSASPVVCFAIQQVDSLRSMLQCCSLAANCDRENLVGTGHRVTSRRTRSFCSIHPLLDALLRHLAPLAICVRRTFSSHFHACEYKNWAAIGGARPAGQAVPWCLFIVDLECSHLNQSLRTTHQTYRCEQLLGDLAFGCKCKTIRIEHESCLRLALDVVAPLRTVWFATN